MSMMKRILALLLSAAVLLAPLGAAAEGYVIPAGEVTSTAISDFYVGGMQIDVVIGFGMEAADATSARAQAVQSLLEKTQLSLSFYDDFGIARVRGALSTDGVALLTLDAMVFEDGSAQMKTNLTGETVLTLPAGTVTRDGVNMGALAFSQDGDVLSFGDPAFKALPARDRLRLTLEDAQMMLMGHLLGWISGTQRETGELYLFDTDFVDATDERDAVALRMVCKITPWDFMNLVTNILWTLRDEHGALQQAVADLLAEAGVTRYQVRQVVDGLLTMEEMDPAVDWVQPSSSVLNDGTLCKMDDIAYAVKKLDKSAEYVMDRTEYIDEVMTLVIGYDDFGELVGVDMDVPIISENAPYEGALNYSVKTDENGQKHHTAHGELEVYDGNRLVGDASMQVGRDVDGVNASGLSGSFDVCQHEEGTSIGVGIDTNVTYRTHGGDDAEAFEANATLSLRQNGMALPMLAASVQGETSVAYDNFLLQAQARVDALGNALTAQITAQANEYDGVEFAAGPALDLTDPESVQQLQQQIPAHLQGILVELSGHAEVMNAVMALIAM